MRKPEKSVKKRIAAHKRATKRSQRLNKTKKDKAKRKASLQSARELQAHRFKKHMNKLKGTS